MTTQKNPVEGGNEAAGLNESIAAAMILDGGAQ